MSEPQLTRDDPRHGTKRGYSAGCRRGTCTYPERQDCTHAHMVYMKRFRSGTTPKLIPALGTWRRLQALQALGWRVQDVADAMGVSKQAVWQLVKRLRPTIHEDTAAAVTTVYESLSMRIGPSDVTRRRSLAKGWEPPLSWDEGDLDNPDAVPHGADRDDPDREYPPELDAAVVTALLAGRRVKANRLERLEVLRASGLSVRELDTQYGWNLHRDQRLEARKDAA